MPVASWFSRALLPWYRENHRALPWRATKDPYRIWLSEVILQQTRVDQGLAYWMRFVARYPTVRKLAAASEDEVLCLWQGLGYYSRARNLRTAARQVVEAHDGSFPADHDELKKLKGVGEYTAAAIGSICFGLPEPVVDGNVYRVLSRAFGIATPIDSTAGRKEFLGLAGQLLDRTQPGDHNQAVMELGATVCTPKNPRCDECPLRSRCVARKEEWTARLPVKSKRAAVRDRHFNYLLIEHRGGILCRKRGAGDIWQGLHELPLVETTAAISAAQLKRSIGLLAAKKLAGPLMHVLSHQRISATLWKAELNGKEPPPEWRRVKRQGLGRLPTHRLMEKLLEGQL